MKAKERPEPAVHPLTVSPKLACIRVSADRDKSKDDLCPKEQQADEPNSVSPWGHPLPRSRSLFLPLSRHC